MSAQAPTKTLATHVHRPLVDLVDVESAVVVVIVVDVVANEITIAVRRRAQWVSRVRLARELVQVRVPVAVVVGVNNVRYTVTI